MNEYEVLSKLLFEKFGKITMDEDETAQVVGCSDKSLQNDRAEAIGIPYTRRTTKERGQVIYLITTVAKHLIDNEIKTI